MADFPIEALKRYTVLAAIHTNNNFDKKEVMENVNKNMLEAAKTIKEIDMLFGRNQPQQPLQYQPPIHQPQYQPPPPPPPPHQPYAYSPDQLLEYVNNLQMQINSLKQDLYGGLNELERIIIDVGDKVTKREEAKGSK